MSDFRQLRERLLKNPHIDKQSLMVDFFKEEVKNPLEESIETHLVTAEEEDRFLIEDISRDLLCGPNYSPMEKEIGKGWRCVCFVLCNEVSDIIDLDDLLQEDGQTLESVPILLDLLKSIFVSNEIEAEDSKYKGNSFEGFFTRLQLRISNMERDEPDFSKSEIDELNNKCTACLYSLLMFMIRRVLKEPSKETSFKSPEYAVVQNPKKSPSDLLSTPFQEKNWDIEEGEEAEEDDWDFDNVNESALREGAEIDNILDRPLYASSVLPGPLVDRLSGMKNVLDPNLDNSTMSTSMLLSFSTDEHGTDHVVPPANKPSSNTEVPEISIVNLPNTNSEPIIEKAIKNKSDSSNLLNRSEEEKEKHNDRLLIVQLMAENSELKSQLEMIRGPYYDLQRDFTRLQDENLELRQQLHSLPQPNQAELIESLNDQIRLLEIQQETRQSIAVDSLCEWRQEDIPGEEMSFEVSVKGEESTKVLSPIQEETPSPIERPPTPKLEISQEPQMKKAVRLDIPLGDDDIPSSDLLEDKRRQKEEELDKKRKLYLQRIHLKGVESNLGFQKLSPKKFTYTQVAKREKDAPKSATIDTASRPVKAYVPAPNMNNKSLIRNALTSVVLAGDANRKKREDVLEVLDSFDAGHFLILFRVEAGKFCFRGIYAILSDTGRVAKLYGSGPITIPTKSVDKLFKYATTRRSFDEVYSREFSASVDAISCKTKYQY